jgi:hypothetical protein
MTTESAIDARNGTTVAATRSKASGLYQLLTRRVWLPKPLYDAAPWIYLAAGCLALGGGLLLPEWIWPLPYLALFGIACLHFGLGIASLRHRRRARRMPDPAM